MCMCECVRACETLSCWHLTDVNRYIEFNHWAVLMQYCFLHIIPDAWFFWIYKLAHALVSIHWWSKLIRLVFFSQFLFSLFLTFLAFLTFFSYFVFSFFPFFLFSLSFITFSSHFVFSLPFFPFLTFFSNFLFSLSFLTLSSHVSFLSFFTLFSHFVFSFPFPFFSYLRLEEEYWFSLGFYDSKRSIGFPSVFLRLEEEYWFSYGFSYRKYYSFRRFFDLKAKVSKIAVWTNFFWAREVFWSCAAFSESIY